MVLEMSFKNVCSLLYEPCYICMPFCETKTSLKRPPTSTFIIHQTHYEKSDWSRAFNQFTIACELNMINAISAADIAFIMSSSQFLIIHDIMLNLTQ